jgi:hypothetical protein
MTLDVLPFLLTLACELLLLVNFLGYCRRVLVFSFQSSPTNYRYAAERSRLRLFCFCAQFELFLRLFCFGRTSHLMGMKHFFDSLHFLDESENDRH